MAELVDAQVSKTCSLWECRFDPGSGYTLRPGEYSAAITSAPRCMRQHLMSLPMSHTSRAHRLKLQSPDFLYSPFSVTSWTPNA